MSESQKRAFFRESQIKYLVLFLWLSIALHAYLFLFGYQGIISMIEKELAQSRPKVVELQNIILETVEETVKKEEDALISDKNTTSSSENPELNKEEEYNFYNDNLQKTITFQQKSEMQNISEAEKEINDLVQSELATITKALPKTNPNPSSIAGSPAQTKYNPDEEVVVNLYSDGVTSLATHSRDFAEYLLKMREKIALYHKEFFPVHLYFQGLTKNGTVIVEFVVDRDGNIVAADISQSIGMDTIDNASLNSVIYAKNFGPLPEELAQNGAVKINFHFVYHRR
ncbi:MAG: energy transducer TonB family protein [Brevinema sp.]